MATTNTSPKNVENLMLKKGLISKEQLDKAKMIQHQTRERLEDIIIRLGFLTERQILDLWAETLNTSVVDLTNIKVDAKLIAIIPEDLAKQKMIVPYKKERNKLTVVMADPFDIITTDMLAFLTKCELSILLAPRQQIEFTVRQIYSWDGFAVSGDESLKRAEQLAMEDDSDSLILAKKTSEQGAVVQFLNAVFKQAIIKRASDIHVEPREDNLLIRFRIDGILHDAMTGPKSIIAPLISRIKILSHLDIAEKRLPQDGRLKVKMQDNEVDFRVSTVPSLLGEKAVMRILQRESKFDLDNIGFFDDDLAKLKSVLDEPYGLILVTGPTGAGKTTTLFGMLKYFNSSEINIFTIENPVEYRMSGITQVQINDKIGLDFASGLRAALRQDPDVILVGEIRDLETAEIAFRASLTGHKVLSTIHTNNAPATINRLINMGVAPYLVTAAVRGIVAQKLLHKNCPKCSKEYRPNQSVIQRLGLSPAKIIGQKFYKGTGCKDCNQTGIYGRQAAYETMIITPSLKEVIMEGGTEAMIKRVARLEGMRTMRESALAIALDGKSTLEEVIYVTPPDDEDKQMPLSALGININAQQGYNMAPMPTYIMPAAQATIINQQTDLSTAQNSNNSTENNENISNLPLQQPIIGQVKPVTVDMNDPVTRAMATVIENDYMFASDEKLAEKLHIPVIQIREIMQFKGLERNRESFEKKFGNTISNFTDEQIEDIIAMIIGNDGDIPAFIMADDSCAERWATAAVKVSLENLQPQLTTPESLPRLFTEEYIYASGLEQIYLWANNSRFRLIDLAMPDRYKPWQFGELEQWMETKELSLCAREALSWLMSEVLQCSRGDLPSLLSKHIFEANALGELLKKFNNSCYELVDAVYPGVFKPWQFTEEEQTLWFKENKMEIAAQATKWLVEERLGIPIEDVPKKISLRDFHTNGLSNLLDLFNQNLHAVIENAYPMQFKPWQYTDQIEIWKMPDANEIARQATEWLITERLRITHEKAPSFVTRRHFITNGLGCMITYLFQGSHFRALENLMPELKTDINFQKNLYDYGQNLSDITIKWSTLSEKIAINHFGKARLKVTMPNMKTAPIVPENERIYINASNQIEYVPQIVIPKLSAYADYSDFSTWVPYCDRLSYWILGDDRNTSFTPPEHPKVKLVFADALISALRAKGLQELVEKVQTLITSYNSLLDYKM